MWRVAALLLATAAAVANGFNGQVIRTSLPAVRSRTSVGVCMMSDDAPKKKYRPSSTGVNPRVYKDRKRNLYNRYYKSTQATALKKVAAAIEQGDKSEAQRLFSLAMSVIDKNVKRGIIHKKRGARFKSRWQKKVDNADAAPATEGV